MGTVGQPGAIYPAEAVSALLGWIEMTVRKATCEAVARALAVSADPAAATASEFSSAVGIAVRLRISKRKAYEMINGGVFGDVFPFGPQTIRVRTSAVDAYIEGQRVTTGAK